VTGPIARHGEWPAWARTWYGYLLRFAVAIWGIATGSFLILIGYYSAVDWKTGESNWTMGAAGVVVAGIVLGLYSLIGSIRPSKALFLPPLILTGLSLLVLIASIIGDLAANLS
jgi:hypothetical protein